MVPGMQLVLSKYLFQHGSEAEDLSSRWQILKRQRETSAEMYDRCLLTNGLYQSPHWVVCVAKAVTFLGIGDWSHKVSLATCEKLVWFYASIKETLLNLLMATVKFIHIRRA